MTTWGAGSDDDSELVIVRITCVTLIAVSETPSHRHRNGINGFDKAKDSIGDIQASYGCGNSCD